MITPEVVKHIADLARIELTDADTVKFQAEFTAILDFVAKLEAAVTTDIEPLSGGHELSNVMREDGMGPARSAEAGPALIEAAPRTRDAWVEVQAVFDRE